MANVSNAYHSYTNVKSSRGGCFRCIFCLVWFDLSLAGRLCLCRVYNIDENDAVEIIWDVTHLIHSNWNFPSHVKWLPNGESNFSLYFVVGFFFFSAISTYFFWFGKATTTSRLTTNTWLLFVTWLQPSNRIIFSLSDFLWLISC